MHFSHSHEEPSPGDVCVPKGQTCPLGRKKTSQIFRPHKKSLSPGGRPCPLGTGTSPSVQKNQNGYAVPQHYRYSPIHGPEHNFPTLDQAK
jgi:hypothetical protein